MARATTITNHNNYYSGHLGHLGHLVGMADITSSGIIFDTWCSTIIGMPKKKKMVPRRAKKLSVSKVSMSVMFMIIGTAGACRSAG